MNSSTKMNNIKEQKVKWIKYGSWSGCQILGTESLLLNNEESKMHIYRAIWLLAQIECGGKFGAINSYDGTGMSAGLSHNVALYPKTMKQGNLWFLLKNITEQSFCSPLQNLLNAFEKGPKWFISQEGILKRFNSDEIITGQEIRNILTPPNGQVPQSGTLWEQAKEWALLFHNLFENKTTYRAQIKSTIDFLTNGIKKQKINPYKIYGTNENLLQLEVEKNIELELDLALCVYHAFSINAPIKARERLSLAISLCENKILFPKILIKILGTTHYANWHNSINNNSLTKIKGSTQQKQKKGRYDKIRIAAMKSGFWPMEFFEGIKAIMPLTFHI